MKNLEVASNVPGIKTGKFEDGNIEFWPGNYGQLNEKSIPGASNAVFDFGDRRQDPANGYGSMQVHNYREKQTVFAFNQFRGGAKADCGIGNAPGKNLDWTFYRFDGELQQGVALRSGRTGITVQAPEGCCETSRLCSSFFV
ncbi:MAG: hypothetical protein L6W00_22665 [Lentisphaeria bacterium]|nr:MAG: hypothetical protein L6W00_22665 [Lentisphaeria bacterium]